MCGVAGIVDLKAERSVDRTALKRMADALAHRGPDGEGFFTEPGIGLAHRRLAIIDIEGGAQPFHSTDGAHVITFNGEIYNYRALKRDLSHLVFRTKSDTEVLLEGLARHGADYVSRLRGMFAFGWWDARAKTLTLARDRFGEKPLYYAVTEDGFLVFASEIGAIEASGLISLRHSAEAMRAYFLYGFVPDPLSIYEGVFKLEPASRLKARRGEAVKIEKYWRPEFSSDAGLSFEAAQEALLERFDDAVKAQTVSDAPLGAFLSGGVDSASIIASLSRVVSPVTTCTIGFDDAVFDERADARRIATRYRTDHHEEIIGVDASAIIDRIAVVFGEPFADPSALPTFEVCAAARRYVKVALSGDGGDELFAGYRRYPFFVAEERIRRATPSLARRAIIGPLGYAYPKLDWAPRPLRFKTTLQSLADDSADAYARAIAMALPDRLDRMLSEDFRRATRDCDPVRAVRIAAADAAHDPLALARKIDLATWLPGRMLTKIDRASMANGLEARAPFLDHALAEWVFSLPPSYLLGKGGGKRLLKASQKARLDEATLIARKRGFSPPIAGWLRRADGPAARLLSSKAWRECGVFDTAAVAKMIDRHQAGASDCSQELWMLVMFDAFLRRDRAAPTQALRAAAS